MAQILPFLRQPHRYLSARMPAWPFSINWDHPYSVDLEFAWVFSQTFGGVDLVGETVVSSVDNSDSSITFVGSELTGGLQARFSGSAGDDRIDLGAVTTGDPLHLPGTPFALTMLYRLDSLTNNFPRIIDKSNGSNAAQGWTYLARDTKNVFQARGREWEWSFTATGLGTFGETHWFTINGITDSSNEGFTDGISVGQSDVKTDTLQYATSTTNAAIGNWNHATGRQLDGAVDVIDWHKGRILTEGEIWDRHNPPTMWDVYWSPGRVFYSIPAAAAAGRIMSSLVRDGGLAGKGGIAGQGGGLAG